MTRAPRVTDISPADPRDADASDLVVIDLEASRPSRTPLTPAPARAGARMRWPVIVAASVAVAISVVVSAGDDDSEPTRVPAATASTAPPAAPTGAVLGEGVGLTLVFATRDGVHALELDSGAEPTLDWLPSASRLVSSAGEAVALVPGGRALSIPGPGADPVRDLGPATDVVTGGLPWSVWLSEPARVAVDSSGDDVPAEEEWWVRSVDTASGATLAGHVVHAPPVAVVGSGLVLAATTGLELFEPRTGAILSLTDHPATVVATTETAVAWVDESCGEASAPCPLHLTDTTSGRERTVSPPRPFGFVPTSGSVAPDGHTLAAATSYPGTGPVTRLTLVDLDTLAVTEVPSADIRSATTARAEWSRSGDWLFFGVPNGRFVQAVRVVDLATTPIETYASDFAVIG